MPGDTSQLFTLVIGVGYTGRRLLRHLPAAVGIGRNSQGEAGVTGLDLDVADYWPDGTVPDSGRYAIVYSVPPSKDSKPDPRLQRLGELLPRAPGRFVYLSTTGVYGDRAGGRVAETTPVAPATDRAERRVEAENLLADWCRKHSVELLVLRVPGIYGPARLGIERIRAAQAVLCKKDSTPGNRIHVDDLVSCCIAALRPETPPGIYNVGDGDERSSRWFMHEVADQAGLTRCPEISRADAARQFSPQRLSFMNESRRIDLSRMDHVLKPALRYRNAADGIAASLAEERRRSGLAAFGS